MTKFLKKGGTFAGANSFGGKMILLKNEDKKAIEETLAKVKETSKKHINETVEEGKLRVNKNVIFIYYGGYGVKDELNFYNEKLPEGADKEFDKSGDTFI